MESVKDPIFDRNIGLFGEEGQEKLLDATVMVVGLGGVGGFACEGIARAGAGTLILVDGDVVDETNLNRQIIADRTTVGRPKTEIMAERIGRIRPEARLYAKQGFVSEENLPDLFASVPRPDMVVDAIDDVAGKLALIRYCYDNGIRIISAMGCANKTDPTRFRVADIYETSVCPLAKKVRKELKSMDIPTLPVVYSTESPKRTGRLASVAYVPSVCGMIIAAEVIKTLLGEEKGEKQ